MTASHHSPGQKQLLFLRTPGWSSAHSLAGPGRGKTHPPYLMGPLLSCAVTRPGRHQAGYPHAHSLVPAPSPRPRPEGDPGRGDRANGRRGVAALPCLWQAAASGPRVTAPAGRSCDHAFLQNWLTTFTAQCYNAASRGGMEAIMSHILRA